MPAEVRRQIFTELLGDRQLHIDHTRFRHRYYDTTDCFGHRKRRKGPGLWKHSVCDSQWQGVEEYSKPFNDEELERNSGNPDDIQEGIVANQILTHDNCYAHRQESKGDWEAEYYRCGSLSPYLGAPEPPPEQLDLRILRACKKVYNECTQVLWASNLLYFDHPKVFAHFVKERTAAQKAIPMNLYLIMDQGFPGQWRKLLTPKFVLSLKGLREIHIVAVAHFAKSYVPKLLESDLLLSAHLSPVTVFRLLSVNRAYIRAIHNWEATQDSWTKTDRRCIEGRLEKIISSKGDAKASKQQTIARSYKLPDEAFQL